MRGCSVPCTGAGCRWGAGGVVAVGSVVTVLVLCGVAWVAGVDMAGSAGHPVAQVESPVAQDESRLGAGQALAGVLVVDRGGVVGGGRLHLLGQDHGLGVGAGGGQGQGEEQEQSGEHAGGWGVGTRGLEIVEKLGKAPGFMKASWYSLGIPPDCGSGPNWRETCQESSAGAWEYVNSSNVHCAGGFAELLVRLCAPLPRAATVD